ncbi:ABC transporter permease [Paenibacillus sedimenti]|uniref:ABC transporter permease subunit n=1 Tax=Paenibacillus sedimenti TaxID=2770274 RepID=A0A926QNC1_9BACL|nr:ABC transporter permease subunit [Paenibacillus sedimenti]MBD0384234.1 ABC transporter permease subunit [Paenibacillus sedimenti]
MWKICALFLIAVMLVGILSPWLVPHPPDQMDVLLKFQKPSWEYPLGTDHLGRCVFSRLLSAIRYSFGGALLVLVLTVSIGIIVGSFTALKGGWFDAIFMRICDILLAFPTLVLAFVLLGMFGSGFSNLILALVLSMWVYYARIIRSMVLSLREKPFMKAAIVSGTRQWGLIFKHMVPNMMLPLLVLSTLEFGGIMLEITGFSFLGLGVQAPTAEWGMMINDGKSYIRQHPELMIYPGIAIMLIVIACNLLGESMRSLYEPGREVSYETKSNGSLYDKYFRRSRNRDSEDSPC